MEKFPGFIRSYFQKEPPPQVDPIHATTFAKMSDNVYDRPGRADNIDGFKLLSDRELEGRGIDPKMLHTDSGMHAHVYKDDHDRTVVSFRGTVNPTTSLVDRPFEPTGMDPIDDMIGLKRGYETQLRFHDVGQSVRDWMTNARQGMGLETQQHNDAVVLAKQCSVAFGKENLAFTGHSKGGGEAELASSVVGTRAMTFNTAGIHPDTLQRHGLDPDRAFQSARDRITSIVTKGEAVNDFLQGRSIGPFEMPDGEKITIKTPVHMGTRVDLVPDDKLNMVSRHLMTPGVLPYMSQVGDLSMHLPGKQQTQHTLSTSHTGLDFQPFQFPMHGRFQQAWLQQFQEPLTPTLSKGDHPANGMYQQALEKVQAHGESGQDAARISGALVVAAQKTGMHQIDNVAVSGATYFATQGELASPASRIVSMDAEHAKQTPLSQSSRESMELSRQQAPQQEAPSQHRAMHRE